MATQPQPPQQPIYPNEFNYALDRLYTRVTGYVDVRIENLIVQARMFNQESLLRDQDLANNFLALAQRVNVVEQRLTVVEQRLTVVEQRLTVVEQRLTVVEQRLTKVEETQQLILQLIRDIHTEVRDNHAEVMEAVNDLKRKNKE